MLREFLYVDVDRTRSLLAQLDKGVVEQVVTTTRERMSITGELNAWVAKGGGTVDTDAGIQESKSLQDLVFVLFEEIGDASGIIRNVEPATIDSSAQWATSTVHTRFEEGELIRLSTPILIVDPVFLDSRFKRFQAMSERLNSLAQHNTRKAVERLTEDFNTETERMISAGHFPGSEKDNRKKGEGDFRRARKKNLGGGDCCSRDATV